MSWRTTAARSAFDRFTHDVLLPTQERSLKAPSPSWPSEFLDERPLTAPPCRGATSVFATGLGLESTGWALAGALSGYFDTEAVEAWLQNGFWVDSAEDGLDGLFDEVRQVFAATGPGLVAAHAFLSAFMLSDLDVPD